MQVPGLTYAKQKKDRSLATWRKITIREGAGRKNPNALERKAKEQKTMKRIGNLYSSICETNNLYLAYEKARKGKAATYGILLFEKNLEANMATIQQELIAEAYKTSEYSVFTVHDPKERTVYRLPFRDRVVHHAIMNILEPIWMKLFISQTYACIKERGIHAVLKQLKKDLIDIENTRFCLKMDIRKFYPSVDHEILKQIIRKKIKDTGLLVLLDEIIDSAPGIPIGNYLSQYFANLYLAYFDHWLKETKHVKYYYRYADDMVILNSNKADLHSLLNDIKTHLADKLRLSLKNDSQIFPVAESRYDNNGRGIDFVGYVFYHKHIRMRKSIKRRFCRKAAKLNRQAIDAKTYRMRIAPWLGWAKHCDSKHLIKKVIKNEEIF